MKEALFYEKLDDNKVKCSLCSHYCTIKPGKRGICAVRENRDGTLYSMVYGKITSRHIDPVEKKPLFQFQPGSRSLSISTVGCNFRCLHCQNWEISQYPGLYGDIPGETLTPEDIVNEAVRSNCSSISYTYTEPTIFMEFAYDCARLAHERGLKNLFVSNGYTSPEAAKVIIPYLDGINIDLKGDDKFYRKVVGAKLEPVLNTIKLMKESGIWVEITTLIIPGHNDDEVFLKWTADFISSIDPSIPWHVTQFYPTYRLTDSPHTPVSTLRRAREIGINAGLRYVYEGNVPGEGGENTYCPDCGELLIERFGFSLSTIAMKGGKCSKCQTLIDGVELP